MNEDLFRELVESVKEGGAILPRRTMVWNFSATTLSLVYPSIRGAARSRIVG